MGPGAIAAEEATDVAQAKAGEHKRVDVAHAALDLAIGGLPSHTGPRSACRNV